MWSVIFYTVAAVAAFYFILLRPVLSQQKAQRMAVRALQIGDEVVTTGGLIGEVKDIVQPVDGPTEIILELAPGVRVRAVTDAISRRLTTLEDVDVGESPGEPEPGGPPAGTGIEEEAARKSA
jgi:preprotein translocase subunit YajC